MSCSSGACAHYNFRLLHLLKEIYNDMNLLWILRFLQVYIIQTFLVYLSFHFILGQMHLFEDL